MKLLSRLFRKGPDPAPPAPEPAPLPVPAAAAAAPLPAVDPAEHEQLLRAIGAGEVPAAELARLAVDGPTTRVRQAAAAAIDDPATWQQLLPQLRGRDKAAYKLLRQRSDALLAGRRQLEQAAQEATALCGSLEKLAGRAHDAAFPVSLELLAARWQALAPPSVDAALRQRGEQALARCREVVAAHQRELARVAAERDAAEARALAEAAEIEARRRAAAEQAAVTASAQSEARAAEAAAAEAQAAQRAVESQALGEVASLMRLAGAALQRGDTRKAARFRQSLEELLPTAPALPPPLSRSLEQLDARLNELRQWKDYVAAPKRIELIEEMEALVGVDEAPEPLAEHIRALRQEWRTLNKGLSTAAPAEAERFEKAWEAAFKPCQAHFAAQAAARRENLEARRRVLERVLAFESGIDAEQPDHPLIARVLREAPQEWRSHAPVDREAARPVEAEFHRALERLRTRVEAWQARNAADKEALVARARQLAQLDDVARAIDEARRLQAEWKATGPAPHAQSQALWEEFRALCNGVFERRQQAFAAQAAALGEAQARAEALCVEIEQAAGGAPPPERQAAESRLSEWRAAFGAIGELPRPAARALQQRFRAAMGRYETLLASQERREAESAETSLLAAAREVRALQRALLQGAPDDQSEALRGVAEGCVAAVTRWPSKATAQALRQALAAARAPGFIAAAGDEAARERALRVLCVRAEILAPASTPPEDAALRREVELQMLRQGLGAARRVEARDWEALRLEWLGIAAVEPGLHEALERRFLRAFGRGRAP